jgi:predicted transport protein
VFGQSSRRRRLHKTLADIRLFQLHSDAARELRAASIDIEKSLQSLMEQHLESFLGVRFLATEYVTGKAHGGRIDTLGLDDNNCPVIIEYKRALNENVISQGLFYLDWLMDHQGEFTLQVLKKLGAEMAEKIDWSEPRLLCIAGDFTRYDEYAVLQIPRNIELLRYRRYGDDLLLLELVRASNTPPSPRRPRSAEANKEKLSAMDMAVATDQPTALQDVWEALKAFLLALGDDVQMKELEQYVAFRRLKNFACVKRRSKDLQVWTRLDPSSVDLVEGFTRDVSQIGHAGTGDLEIRIQNAADLERAQPLLLRSYQGT